ncbi:MAG: GIY-YIG nuclease family protein [Bacteroidales bacterium]
MNKFAFVYFITNAHNTLLYIGVTNDLRRRIAEHKAKITRGFTQQYNCNKLVYFEQHSLITAAIAREKQIKNWQRVWKDALVNKDNPKWEDLSESIGVTPEWVENVKEAYQSGDCGTPHP